MADRTIKPDSGNDLVLQNNGGGTKIEIPNSGDIAITGNVTATLSSSSVVPASVGSSFVLVKSSQGFTCTNSTTLASAYIENCFNSSYRDYRIIITGQAGTTASDLGLQVGNSSTLRVSSSSYYFTVRGHDSLGSPYLSNAQGSSQIYLLNGVKASGDFDRFVIDMIVHNPQATGATAFTGTSSHVRAGTAYITNYIGGYFDVSFQATNLQFFFNTGTENRTINFQSYGIKTS